MTAYLASLDAKLATIDIFKRQGREKREELADAIYMCALRSGLSIDEVIPIVRTPIGLDESFFIQKEGNIFSFVPKKYLAFAKRLFIKRAGGGTPNAAMGKAELFLLLLSDKTNKPAKGDISFCNRNIEIKTNGGKFGLGNGDVANAKVVEFCNREGIELRKATVGKVAKGKLVFDPTMKTDRDRVGKRLPDVLAIWWEALSGSQMSNATWPRVRKAFLQNVADVNLTNTNMELMVFETDGEFRHFKNSTEFVKYYNNERTRFECRGYQKNPFSIYLRVFQRI